MDAIGIFGFTILAGAAMLAITAGAAAAVSAPSRFVASTAVVPVHGCHIGCVKTGPHSSHRHVGRACRRMPCGQQAEPPPPRR